MRLKGKRILITGGARGLGRAFAEAAIAAGAKVVIADILLAQGKKTAEEIGAEFVRLDLSNERSIRRCAGKLKALDALVNNGAITNSGGRVMDQLDTATWDKVMAVNVRGVWLMTKAVLPLLRKSKAGRVVNIASDTAMWGAPRLLAYTTSKGAVMAMTRTMARELGPDRITVNAIAPGLTLVEATEYVPKERHDLYVNGRAIKRAQMPEDICGTLLFLLSDDAAFVTGQSIPVNGGFVVN